MTRLPMTFVGTDTPPRRRSDWADIGRTAAQLLAEREKAYPAMVKDGRLEQALADQRIRTMCAIVALWRVVLEGGDLPEPPAFSDRFGASWQEMLEDADRAAGRARDLADRKRGDRDAAVQAELVTALAWQHRPVCGSAGPHIWLSHGYARWEHRRQTERPD